MLREKCCLALELPCERHEPLIVIGGIGSGKLARSEHAPESPHKNAAIRRQIARSRSPLCESHSDEKDPAHCTVERRSASIRHVHHISRLIRGVLRRARAHVQSVDQFPSAGVEKIRRLRIACGVIFTGAGALCPVSGPTAKAKAMGLSSCPAPKPLVLAPSRPFAASRVQCRTRWCCRRSAKRRTSQPPDKPSQIGILPRKEIWIAQLRRLVTQSSKVVANFVAKPVGTKGQPNRSGWLLGQTLMGMKGSAEAAAERRIKFLRFIAGDFITRRVYEQLAGRVISVYLCAPLCPLWLKILIFCSYSNQV